MTSRAEDDIEYPDTNNEDMKLNTFGHRYGEDEKR